MTKAQGEEINIRVTKNMQRNEKIYFCQDYNLRHTLKILL